MKDLEFHIKNVIDNNINKNDFDTPVDYFSWGRDSRHLVDNTENISTQPSGKYFHSKVVSNIALFLFRYFAFRSSILFHFKQKYASFNETYHMMSDQHSKELFAELIAIKLVSEKKMRLSSFTKDFIESYEVASENILTSSETLSVYRWVLRKITLNNPSVSIFTTPAMLNLHYTGRVYRYCRDNILIEVEKGDIVIDAGVGWGDTTIYLAALADSQAGGWLYAFDILAEGVNALSEQCKLNQGVKNITPVLRGLSDQDGEHVSISSPSPGAKIIKGKTGRKIETITIDSFSKEKDLKKVDFIKMDIEGAEVPALIGAKETIKKFKPKLAISAYHKWDDLLIIPKLIHSIRDDYNYYIDCTTGFGGETVLYCK